METLKGNLGISYKEGRPVTTILMERLPNTLLLFGVTCFSLLLAQFGLGTIAGIKAGSIWDRGLSTASIATSSIPAFWLGFYLFHFLQ